MCPFAVTENEEEEGDGWAAENQQVCDQAV